jgi:integrase
MKARGLHGMAVPGTRYNRSRFVLRFQQYCLATGQSGPRTVQAWLRLLPASQQSSAKNALRGHLGKQALDWSAIETATYRRDDGALAAGVFREEHRERLRQAANSPQELALTGCLLTLRRAEVAAMRWGHLNLSTGMVLVPKGKGGRSSWTLLTVTAQTDLAAWFDAAGSPPDEAPIFQTPRGRAYTPGGIGKWTQRLLTRAGLWASGLGCSHRFRRSLATEYLRSNPGDLVGLQKIMRHEQVSTTARYAWLTSDDLAPRLARVRL